jgi:ribonuclease BN (tRNA processing enzyme)
VLTHVPPWGDPQDALAEARTTYDGEIELATAGAVFEV